MVWPLPQKIFALQAYELALTGRHSHLGVLHQLCLLRLVLFCLLTFYELQFMFDRSRFAVKICGPEKDRCLFVR